MSNIIVAPSLLSAKFNDLEKSIEIIEKSGADWVHLDVMDGSFVPVITFGHKMVSDLRPLADLPFDVHLMVKHPETFIDSFAAAGADYITIHEEATVHINRVIQQIRLSGKKPGISIIPSTPVSHIMELLPFVDLVLIMTVNPGFGGQSMIDNCLLKVSLLKEIKKEKGYNFVIEIDGGVNIDTYEKAIKAGTEVLVTGSAFFKAKNHAEYVKLLKSN